MTSARSIAAISAVLVGLTAPVARAQPTEADALFAHGKQLLDQDQLDEACASFEASNQLDPRAGTLIWLGECRARNRQFASAWVAYRDALARVKDPSKRSIAAARLAAVEDRLSYLLVVVADDHRPDGLTITCDGQPLAPDAWNRGVPVDGGAHTIAASAPGHAAWTTTVIVPAERGRERIEVPVLELTAPPSTERAPAASTTAVALQPAGTYEPDVVRPASPAASPPGTTAPRDAEPPAWTTRRTLALGLAGASAAGWVAGAVLGVQARNAQASAFELCDRTQTTCADGQRANQLLDGGARRALGANIAFGAAAATAIGAAVLWFTGAPTARHGVAVVPALSPERAGVMVSGRL
jgi:hypothetical protein